jgi:hypothetical protein
VETVETAHASMLHIANFKKEVKLSEILAMVIEEKVQKMCSVKIICMKNCSDNDYSDFVPVNSREPNML